MAMALFFLAATALAASTALPWVSALGVISVGLPGGAVLYVLLFAAAYGWVGYMVRVQRVPRGLLIATWVINVWMVINVFAIFSELGDDDDVIKVSPAAGVFIASAGVIAALVATVQLNRSRV